ncbi:putative elongator complex protein 1 [Lithohypha guttulata]|nr:putative elongator complex protein 1 [Lithohypha guttulata]
MRNLIVSEVVETKFDNNDLPLTATAFDTSTGEVICAFGPAPEKQVIELRRCKSWLEAREAETTLITSWDAPSPLSELDCDRILSLRYLHDTGSICIVLAGGDLIVVREKPLPDQERIEIVGSIDVGVSAAQWSSTTATLAIITRAGSFVLMSQQLEPVSEVALQRDDLRLSKHVSVGWGKKETQFQGKRAKAMKDPTMPEHIEEGKPTPNDNGETVVSWRGDGAFVAVNSTIASDRRVIRVYSADGVLDSVSEPVDGLESALSWRPYGNLLAGIKRTIEGKPKLEVVFFERNGLRHGDFDLRLSEQEMASFGANISLLWNCDSSILAVVMLDRVQLWTMGNYHYYLKQEFRLKSLSLEWHKHDPLKFCISNGRLNQSISLSSKTDGGSICPPFDYGLVSVIDGKSLKLTPLKHANVPPPMAYAEVQATENIISCTFSRTCQRLAFLTHSHLYLCKWEMRPASPGSTTSIRHTTNISMQKKNLDMFPRPTQIVIHNDDAVYLLAPSTSISDPRALCYKYTWVNTNAENPEIKTQDIQIPLDTKQILLSTNQESVWFRTATGLWDISLSSQLPPAAGPATDVIDLPSGPLEPHCQVSLSKAQQLIINNVVKATQVTSYAVTNRYIIYTTATHLLKFVHLTNDTELVFPNDTPEVDERCRAIERGAQIVTIIPSSYAVILQMPRGNLETIYPRIMVLSGIREHIDSLEYRKAFLACRNHQVDLNILYDYNPELWSCNLKKFVEQLKKPSRIDEFIQKLKDEDVTKTLYRDTSKHGLENEDAGMSAKAVSASSKVNRICDALITILGTKSAEYQQNIITAHICKKPPDTVAALRLVSSLRQVSEEEVDLTIAHLCFLSDTNRLYDTALGLYDLELTLLVAQNAQRDPKEYMPFLQSLQALPRLRREYTIDNHLKRYAKATNSLHAMDEHDELEAYTVKHNLYAHVEDLYKHDAPHLHRIVRLHADFLTSQSYHAAAATLYESLLDYTEAYPLYALAHMWRESLSCAALIQPPLLPDRIRSLAHSLATTCTEESRDYRSAATIHLDYLDDPVAAAELLCKASYFAEATRVLSHPARNLASQVSNIVDPMLTRKFGEIIELIADCQTQLASQVPRIEELRIKKAEDPLAFYGGDAAPGEGADIPDNISLAPTDASTQGGQSMFTRYGGGAGGSQASTKFAGTVASNMSRRTSKTKRREERKRARGKKGSVYEEEYLVASIARLIDRVNGTHDEVRRLVSGLRRRGLREQAAKVDEIMLKIHGACEDARLRVWPETARVEENSIYHINGDGRPNGTDGALYDGQIDVQERAKPPTEVKLWKVDM